MRWLWGTSLALSVLLAGCHSKYIQATVTNNTALPLHVVQVDYPSASFGTQELDPGQAFHYQFKLLGSGPLKVSFTDAKMQDHTQNGPVLHEGEEGFLSIVFRAQDRAEFQVSVHP